MDSLGVGVKGKGTTLCHGTASHRNADMPQTVHGCFFTTGAGRIACEERYLRLLAKWHERDQTSDAAMEDLTRCAAKLRLHSQNDTDGLASGMSKLALQPQSRR